MRIQIIIILIQILNIFGELSDELKTDLNSRLDSITENLLKSSTPYWHSAHLEHQNREEIQVTKLVLDETFQFGFNITRWQSFKIGIKQYAIGSSISGFTVIVFSANGTVLNTLQHETGKAVKSLTNTLRWNSETRQMELITACLTYENSNYQIEWFQLRNNDYLMSLWVWKLSKEAIEIEIIKRNQIRNLIILNKENSKYKTSIDVFKFSFDDPNDYWITQHIPLLMYTEKFTFNVLNENTYLTLQHKSDETISIYKLTAYDSFGFFQDITIPKLQSITSFKLNNRNYLFAGGYDLHLYEITAHDEVQKIDMDDGINFGVIVNIVPIKVSTYRDDVIFLIEHSIDYGTWESNTVEMLYYHNGIFKKHEEIACVYYGVTEYGLSCLIDEDTDLGIWGAISLEFNRLNVTKVLIPRAMGRNSELFCLEAKLNPVPNPIESDIKKFMEMKNNIMELYMEQQKFIKELEKRVNQSKKVPDTPDSSNNKKLPEHIESKFHLNSVLNEINDIKATIENLKQLLTIRKNDSELLSKKSLELNKGLQVNGNLKIENLVVEHINGHSLHDILNSTIRKDRKFDLIKGQKTLTNITVDNLHFLKVNNLHADSIAYRTGKDIVIDGNLIFTNNVSVNKNVILPKDGSETVNDIVLKRDILQMDKFFDGPLTLNTLNISKNVLTNLLNNAPVPISLIDRFQQSSNIPENGQVFCNTLHVAGAVNTFKVNGIHLDDLLSRIVLRNQPKRFNHSITVLGNIFTKSNITMKFLNEKIFDREFVFASGSPFTTIKAQKHFLNTISTFSANVQDKVDDVELDTLISLQTNEEFENDFTFENLEVTETFQVDGIISGSNLPKFLPNPTIRETKDIKSNVIFKRLKVEGDIIIQNTINNSTWDDYLGDIVYKDELNTKINSIKTFKNPVTIFENLEIASNMFNHQNISEIVNKRSDDDKIIQNMLNGIVTIENLELSGLYDSVNITELNEQSVKTFGDQYVTSEIIFDELDSDVNDFMTVDLEIIDKLNGISYQDFKEFFSENSVINNLNVENIFVDGNLISDNSNWNPRNSIAEMNESKNKYRTANVRNVELENVNNVSIVELKQLFDRLNNYKSDLKKGLISVREIFVNGSIQTNIVNNHNFKETIYNAIYINKVNTNIPNVCFLDELHVENLIIENWNDENFQKLFSDLIGKTENNIYITGSKIFENGFHVIENIETDKINDMKISDIILKTNNSQIFSGPLKVTGDVMIDNDLMVNGNLSKLQFSDVQKYFSEDEFGNIIINGDVAFLEPSEIKNLNAYSYINDKHLPSFLKKMVMKGSHMEISGTFKFLNKVNFENNLVILNQYNEIPSVSKFMDNIIVLNKDNYLKTPVIFGKDVMVQNSIKIRNNFDTIYINGVDMTDWKTNTIDFRYIEIISGNIIFENLSIKKDLSVWYLNNMDMDTLITLREPQEIKATLEFLQIEMVQQRNIPVGNLVNGVILQEEYENTVKNTIEKQTIETETIFHAPILISEGLFAMNPINQNRINLDKIVTTDTDQQLKATYIFDDKVKLRETLLTDYIIGIDLKKLETKGVRLDDNQLITGDWIVSGNLTFHDSVFGDGGISSFDLQKYVDAKNTVLVQRQKFEVDYNRNYQNACENVEYLRKCADKQMYMFEYFDIAQVIDDNRIIESMHHFKINSKHYLLISYAQTCISIIYEWSPTYEHFTELQTINISPIQQWIHVPYKSKNYFLSRSYTEHDYAQTIMECQHFGTNLWLINDDFNWLHKYRLQNVTMLQPKQFSNDGNFIFYGIHKNIVYEFNMNDIGVRKRRRSNNNNMNLTSSLGRASRQWKFNKDKLSFIPNDVGLGLSVTDGQNVYSLNELKYRRTSGQLTNETLFNNFTLSSIRVDNLADYNDIVPIVVNRNTNVQKTFIAVPVEEQTQIKGALDFIKIYENSFDGDLFQKVATYKPSQLNTMSFGDENGETLLLFLEDQKQIQIFKYKGIEGFKQFNDYSRTIKLPGNILKVIQLPVDTKHMLQNYILLVDNSTVRVIETIVAGDKFQNDNAFVIKCPDY